jgi:hypothetical protein
MSSVDGGMKWLQSPILLFGVSFRNLITIMGRGRIIFEAGHRQNTWDTTSDALASWF